VSYTKPVPTPTKEDRPFWEAAKRHEFVLPRCRQCGHVWFPPYLNCQRCLSLDREWMAAGGQGSIDGFTVLDKAYIAAFADDVPYNVALVLLDEGPRMYSNIVEIANDDIVVGMRVEVVFDDVTDEISLPKFRPVTS
jgi:uncharacterized OB-fold protein